MLLYNPRAQRGTKSGAQAARRAAPLEMGRSVAAAGVAAALNAAPPAGVDVSTSVVVPAAAEHKTCLRGA